MFKPSAAALAALSLFAAATAVASPFSARHARGGYPAAIVNAGLQAEWQLLWVHPGPRSALTDVTSYTPPSGVAYSSSSHALSISSTADVSGVDLNGNSLLILNDSTVATIHDVRLNSPFGYVLFPGQNSGGGSAGNPTANVAYCVADLTGSSAGHAAPIGSASSQPLSFDHCTFKNASRDPITLGGTLNVSWSYFAWVGQNTVLTDHQEFIHWLGSGGGTISHSVFNALDSKPGGADGGISGGFQIQSDNAAITNLVFDRIIFYGAKAALGHQANGSPSSGVPFLSLKAVNFDVTVHVGHSVIQADPNGKYVINTALNGHLNHIIDDGGNYDFDTGLPINLTLN